MDRSLPVADCLEGGVEVGGGHGDELLAVWLLQELVLLARGLPQLRADVHQQVHVGNALEKVLLGGAVHTLVGPLVIDVPAGNGGALGRCCPGSTALDESEVSTGYC